MDLPQKLKTFLASIVASVIRIRPESDQPISLTEEQPSLPESPTSIIHIESPQSQRLPSTSSPPIPPESDQPRSLTEEQPSLPEPATSIIHIESPQPQRLPSTSSPPPSNDYDSPQSQLPLPPPTPTAPSNLKLQLESIHAAQQHLQWQNAVLAFCFSYALGVSLQFVGTDQSNHHQLPFSLVLLSFLVLLTFTFILLAFFIHRNSTRTSQALEKVAFLLALAAFCQTLSIPFSFELTCAVWAVFLLSLLIVMIFAYLIRNTE